VDDNLDAAVSMAELLKIFGHQVTTASNGQEAIEASRWLQPDLMLLDLAMPRMSGITVVKALRADPDPALSKMKIVAVSGYTTAQMREDAIAAGFDDYLIKPVEFVDLARIVGKLNHTTDQ
jgi:CheY-like chemotaxis protein